MCGRDILA
ncbi:hypothetical protein Nmel_002155 [Mimus melanotis]